MTVVAPGMRQSITITGHRHEVQSRRLRRVPMWALIEPLLDRRQGTIAVPSSNGGVIRCFTGPAKLARRTLQLLPVGVRWDGHPTSVPLRSAKQAEESDNRRDNPAHQQPDGLICGRTGKEARYIGTERFRGAHAPDQKYNSDNQQGD